MTVTSFFTEKSRLKLQRVPLEVHLTPQAI